MFIQHLPSWRLFSVHFCVLFRFMSLADDIFSYFWWLLHKFSTGETSAHARTLCTAFLLDVGTKNRTKCQKITNRTRSQRDSESEPETRLNATQLDSPLSDASSSERLLVCWRCVSVSFLLLFLFYCLCAYSCACLSVREQSAYLEWESPTVRGQGPISESLSKLF